MSVNPHEIRLTIFEKNIITQDHLMRASACYLNKRSHLLVDDIPRALDYKPAHEICLN